jgi:hypothetical protein
MRCADAAERSSDRSSHFEILRKLRMTGETQLEEFV